MLDLRDCQRGEIMKFKPLFCVVIVVLTLAGLCSAIYGSDSTFQEPIISVSASVFEGGNEMEMFNDGKVECYSTHYVPEYKVVTVKERYIPKTEIDALVKMFQNSNEYSEYTVDFEHQLEGQMFDSMSFAKISCLPLNRSIELNPSFQEPGTAPKDVIEILRRIDDIYTEIPIIERRKEINPTLISIDLDAESFNTSQIITFNATLKNGLLGDVASYEWDFDDGSKGYGELVCHSYLSAGNYTVKLAVTTSSGAVGEKYRIINVTDSTITPTPVPEVQGFEVAFAIIGLLAVSYLLREIE